MAARKRRMTGRRRKNRGRSSGLFILLSIIVICVTILAGCIVFFKTNHMAVQFYSSNGEAIQEGTAKYTAQEVVAASGVQIGDNLFLLNKFTVANRIFDQLYYIREVEIRRSWPDGLLFLVTESNPMAVIAHGENHWIVAEDGKLLEKTTASRAKEFLTVEGVKLLAPSGGTYLAFPEGEKEKATLLTTLLGLVEKWEMKGKITQVDLTEQVYLYLRYEDRFTVKVPVGVDYDYYFKTLDYVIGMLQENEKGMIDMTLEGETHFIPDKE